MSSNLLVGGYKIDLEPVDGPTSISPVIETLDPATVKLPAILAPPAVSIETAEVLVVFIVPLDSMFPLTSNSSVGILLTPTRLLPVITKMSLVAPLVSVA